MAITIYSQNYPNQEKLFGAVISCHLSLAHSLVFFVRWSKQCHCDATQILTNKLGLWFPQWCIRSFNFLTLYTIGFRNRKSFLLRSSVLKICLPSNLSLQKQNPTIHKLEQKTELETELNNIKYYSKTYSFSDSFWDTNKLLQILMIHTTQHLHLQLVQKITDKPICQNNYFRHENLGRENNKTEICNTHQNLKRKGLKRRRFRIEGDFLAARSLQRRQNFHIM